MKKLTQWQLYATLGVDKQIKLGQCVSHSHSTVIGYCDILDVVTILSLPHGSHNIRYPVYLYTVGLIL